MPRILLRLKFFLTIRKCRKTYYIHIYFPSLFMSLSEMEERNADDGGPRSEPNKNLARGETEARAGASLRAVPSNEEKRAARQIRRFSCVKRAETVDLGVDRRRGSSVGRGPRSPEGRPGGVAVRGDGGGRSRTTYPRPPPTP